MDYGLWWLLLNKAGHLIIVSCHWYWVASCCMLQLTQTSRERVLCMIHSCIQFAVQIFSGCLCEHCTIMWWCV